MKIGIIVAMDKEFTQLKTLLTESQTERKNHKDFVIGKIGNNEVVMQQCGIGKVNSTIGAVEMIDNYHPDLVISSGVAGGADINLNVTEVVVATDCVYHDAYCGDECEFGQILGMPATFKTPKEYVEKALAINEPARQQAPEDSCRTDCQRRMVCRQQGEDALYPGALPSGHGCGYGELLHRTDLPHLQDSFHLLPHHQRCASEGYQGTAVLRLLG